MATVVKEVVTSLPISRHSTRVLEETLDTRISRLVKLRIARADDHYIASSLQMSSYQLERMEYDLQSRIWINLSEGLTEDQIADTLEVPRSTLDSIVRIYEMPIRKNFDKERLRRFSAICHAIAKGAQCISHIALIATTHSELVAEDIADANIKFIKGVEAQIYAIRHAFSIGADSAEAVSEVTGIPLETVIKLAKADRMEIKGVKLPISRNDTRRQALIDMGLSIGEIRRLDGVSNQRVEQCIGKRGRGIVWHQARDAIKSSRPTIVTTQGRQLLSEIVYLMTLAVEQRVNKEMDPDDDQARIDLMAYKKAINYATRKRVYGHDVRTIFRFFQLFYTAKFEGYKIKLSELAEATGIPAMTGSDLLRREGEEPSYGARRKFAITPEIEGLIQRSHAIPMPSTDKAYFTGIPAHIIQQNSRDTPKTASYIIKFPGGICLTYRTASQIYEGIDILTELKVKYKTAEVAHYSTTSCEAVRYAMHKRDRIAPIIIDALRTLYPMRNIRKPYRNWTNPWQR